MTGWEQIQEEVAEACREAGREPEEVTIVAVSKLKPEEDIRNVYDQGCRIFGESRVQEAAAKIAALPSDIQWHFIGPLQSNKAKKAAQLFDCIHSICSEQQLQQVVKAKRPIDYLLQINLGEEEQKAGIFADALDAAMEFVAKYPEVRWKGLMGVSPLVSNPEESRVHFRRLAQLGRQVGAEWLSMGMSSDFRVAIQEGATHVRIGSAIFGRRA